jgi:hypothetical protein
LILEGTVILECHPPTPFKGGPNITNPKKEMEQDKVENDT